MTVYREGNDARASVTTQYGFSVGDSYLGDIGTRGDRDWYEISLEEGVIYEIDLRGDNSSGQLADPFLRVYDASGTQVYFNDDGGIGRDSFLRFSVAQSGTYYVAAGAYGDYGTGFYELSVEGFREIPANPTSDVLTSVGEEFEGRLELAGDRDWVGVELFGEREYQVDLAGDGTWRELWNPLLRVREGDGTFIRGNDNAGGTNDSRVIFTTDETGRYFLDASSSNLSGTGDYLIAVADTGSDVVMGTSAAEQTNARWNGGAYYLLEGNDTFIAGSGADLVHGGSGRDTVSFANATWRVMVDLENSARNFGDAIGNEYISIEVFRAGDYADQLRGDAEDNIFYGGGFSDRLYGRAGNDTLDGEDGADAIYGNAGADVMTGGGDPAQRDRFIYFQQSDSGVGKGERDVITDFVAGVDRIEIWRLDADTTRGGNQVFEWVGRTAFSQDAGELRYFNTAQGNTIIQADVDGDGTADFEIELSGVVALSGTDFLL